MWWLLCVVAFAGKYDDVSSDVVRTSVTNRPPEMLYERLADLANWPEIFGDTCMTDWSAGSQTQGVGGQMALTYHMGPMKRRLVGTINKAEASYVIEVDHGGRRGFITQIQLKPNSVGTEVTLGTYLNPPPWPFKATYYTKVKPAWEACYNEGLQRL